MPRIFFALVGALVLSVVTGPTSLAGANAASASAPLVGAASTDWAWLDRAVGPLQIYRSFDSGFHYATWQQTPAYQLHPNAPMVDYSTEVAPEHLITPGDPMIAEMKTFIASTPRNAILSNLHEPDHSFPGRFTAAQYRASILRYAGWVRAQNAADGGTRMTSVILMDVTFGVYGTTTADQWWPTDARDGGHVDIIEGDMYALPHATNTTAAPAGYTDGVKWRTAAYTLDPLRKFAQANKTPWAVAELGYLEDVSDPNHKAAELAAAVAYARAWGAHHVNYFDAAGRRGNWRLRYASPVGTQSETSRAALAWRSLAGN